MMLSQMLYWTDRTSDGSFYKTADEWQAEIGISRNEQTRIRKQLMSLGVITELKKGIPCKIHFSVNIEALNALLDNGPAMLTIDQVLAAHGGELASLSKAAMMRARRYGQAAQYIAYADVLKMHGMSCHCCKEPILMGLGSKDRCLTFDYLTPLEQGGEYSLSNFRASHMACSENLAKERNVSYSKETISLKPKEQSLLHQEQAGVYSKENNTEITKDDAENTYKASPAGEPALPAHDLFGDPIQVEQKGAPEGEPKPPEQPEPTDPKDKKTKPVTVAQMLVDYPDLHPEVAEEFLTHRKRKKALLTPLSWKGLMRELGKTQWTMSEALTECLMRGWVAFKADWLNNADRNSTGGSDREQRQQRQSKFAAGLTGAGRRAPQPTGRVIDADSFGVD